MSSAPPNEETLKRLMDEDVKANMQVFDRAQSHNNAITAIGFAGIFAIWSFSKGALTRW